LIQPDAGYLQCGFHLLHGGLGGRDFRHFAAWRVRAAVAAS
jgi:hypothetical protein